ncbi:uncharacterized protein LOC113505994 [Trichoplusia ni]|uniref:Uncharacterized protein LOC113505994 n=1 Tax=Trichoplusia ni TaxID=7111 RepID=A0A7E5WWW6_TRINI|nr:uncharacterized protein LOC113505994 [Trichoplusia ni]
MVKTCCIKWCNREAYAGCGSSFFRKFHQKSCPFDSDSNETRYFVAIIIWQLFKFYNCLIIQGKENLEPTPGTSMEPPFKKARQEQDFENVVAEKKILQYKVKLLSQRLKRRDSKINNLKSALNIMKKKCSNFEEVESVLVNNFSNSNSMIC